MFYAYCQALFYITCFRAKQFCGHVEGRTFLQTLPFEALASSSLQPLKVRLPACSVNGEGDWIVYHPLAN